MNTLEFYKLMAPLVALSKEDHIDMTLPKDVSETLTANGHFMPIIIVFLGKELFCNRN